MTKDKENNPTRDNYDSDKYTYDVENDIISSRDTDKEFDGDGTERGSSD